MLLSAEAVTTKQMEISLDGTRPKFLPLQRAHAVSTGSAPDCCVPQTRQEAWVGPPSLDVRIWCEVSLIFGSDIRHPFIKWIGIARDVVKMVHSDLPFFLQGVDSDLLM